MMLNIVCKNVWNLSIGKKNWTLKSNNKRYPYALAVLQRKKSGACSLCEDLISNSTVYSMMTTIQ